MKGFDYCCIDNILIARDQSRTRSNRFELDTFRVNRDRGETYICFTQIIKWEDSSSNTVVSASAYEENGQRAASWVEEARTLHWYSSRVGSNADFVQVKYICKYFFTLWLHYDSKLKTRTNAFLIPKIQIQTQVDYFWNYLQTEILFFHTSLHINIIIAFYHHWYQEGFRAQFYSVRSIQIVGFAENS